MRQLARPLPQLLGAAPKTSLSRELHQAHVLQFSTFELVEDLLHAGVSLSSSLQPGISADRRPSLRRWRSSTVYDVSRAHCLVPAPENSDSGQQLLPQASGCFSGSSA